MRYLVLDRGSLGGRVASSFHVVGQRRVSADEAGDGLVQLDALGFIGLDLRGVPGGGSRQRPGRAAAR